MKKLDIEARIGTKLVHLVPMTRGEYNHYREWTTPADEEGDEEGYLVIYKDEYENWSPKKQADEAYHASGEFTFGDAVYLLKGGAKCSRKGMPEGMYVYYVPPASYPATRNEAGTMLDIFPDNMVPYEGYLAIHKYGSVAPWTPPQADVLASDWSVV